MLAAIVTLLGTAAVILGPLVINEAATEGEEVKVITLTGVAETGTWTEEEVTAFNYLSGEFRPARPVLEAGRLAVLRLKSADVHHGFYSPSLGIGPIDVHPGQVEEVTIRPESVGTHPYYCTSVCGKAHFGMRGDIIVVSEGEGPRDVLPGEGAPADPYWTIPRPSSERPVDRGEWLFRQKGCFTCHGVHGQGGVQNWNYVKETVPALDAIGERMLLYFPEDMEEVLQALDAGVPLESLADKTSIPRFGAVLAQYESLRNVIHNGNPAGRKDESGLHPPLEMPSWENHLSEEDIDALLAYFLALSIEKSSEQ